MAGSLRKVSVINMLAKRQLIKLVSRSLSTTCLRSYGGGGSPGNCEIQNFPRKTEIGTREVVGYGYNGEESYIDSLHAPFPAIRFKEDTPEILKIKEKEAGDWKKMTLEEKKALYRHSFAQTLTELQEPTGDWKKVLGITCLFLSFSIWSMIWLKFYVYDPLQKTITDEEYVKASVKRMIDMRVNPVQGLTSNYDYEKNEWKD